MRIPSPEQLLPITSRGEQRKCAVLDERFARQKLLRYYRQYVGWLDAYPSQQSAP